MMQIPMDQFTRQGIDAVRAGRYGTGRQFLVQALKLNARNTLAWLWLAACTNDRARKRECLLRVLAIEPNHPFARRDLEALDGTSAPPLPGIRSDQAALPPLRARPSQPPHPAQVSAPEGSRQASRVGSTAAPAFTGVAAAAAQRQTGLFTTAQPARSSSPASTAPAPPAAIPGDAASKPADALAPRAPMTADDAVVIAAHRQTAQAVEAQVAAQDQADVEDQEDEQVQAGEERRRLPLLIPALLLASLLIGMLARHVTGSPSRIVVGEPSRAARAALSPKGAASATPSDVLASAGTGFLDGSGLLPMADATPALVPLWPEPFTSEGAAACAMPHATAVLVLQTRTTPDGERSFLVQHRECVGWVPEALLKELRDGETPPAPEAPAISTSKK